MTLHSRGWIQARSGRVLGSVAFALALAASACGPTGYIMTVTMDASSSVAAAQAVGADKLAPYEYTRAVEYLHKAREEAANADFQAANRFGRLAHEAALEAKRLAVRRAADKDNTDWMPPPSLRDKGQGDREPKDKPAAGDTTAPAGEALGEDPAAGTGDRDSEAAPPNQSSGKSTKDASSGESTEGASSSKSAEGGESAGDSRESGERP